MSANTNTAASDTDLSARALLATLSISTWQARKNDADVSRTAAAQYDAADSAGSYHKQLIVKAALQPIMRAVNDARSFHYANTLPWTDNGPRVLACQNIMDYMQALHKLRDDFESAVEAFVPAYPTHVAEARKRLGKMFRDADYPSVESVKQRFVFDVSLMPLPDTGDLRIDVADDVKAQIQRDAQQRVDAALSAALADIWQRAEDVLTQLVERLSIYDDSGDGRVLHPFRDTVITNIRELATLIPKLNVTGEASINRLAGDLADISKFSPDMLRVHAEARRTLILAANRLLHGSIAIGKARVQ